MIHSKDHVRETQRKEALDDNDDVISPSRSPSEKQQVMSMASSLQILETGWISLHFFERRTNGNSDRIPLNY